MSHRCHSSVVSSASRIVNDVKKLSREEAEQLYGIQIRDDRTIFDVTYQMTFNSLHEWAKFTIEQDNGDLYEDVVRYRGDLDDE